ncbi:MAG: glycosyltransferase family 4 protein [Candidatus Poribacteria bacterium]|nr:glycosyltransferase family 4 protein [Candidatus Poribacteria bacterium]
MRIVHLIYDDLENPWLGGGGAKRTHEIYKRLAKEHDILVLTGGFPGALPEIERDQVTYRRIGRGKTYLLSVIDYVLGVIKEIRSLPFDLLVEDFCAFFPVFSPLWVNAPVIASIQAIFGIETIKKRKVLGLPAFAAEKVGLHFYRNFIAVSPAQCQFIKQKIGQATNIEWIPNAPEETLFLSKSQEENFILYLGRLEVYGKGLDTLIKAYAKVAETKTQIHLKIAGDGKDAEIKRLENLIHRSGLVGRVELVGKIKGEKKVEMLSRCLFVCIPSRFEGWPIVAIEAAASQKAIIGTNIPGLSDTVQNRKTGILVNLEDIEALSGAMNDLIENKALRVSLGQNARVWARNFSWNQSAIQQEQFYLRVVRQR